MEKYVKSAARKQMYNKHTNNFDFSLKYVILILNDLKIE